MMTMIGIKEAFGAFEAVFLTTFLDHQVDLAQQHPRQLPTKKEKLLKNKSSRKNDEKDFGNQKFFYS